MKKSLESGVSSLESQGSHAQPSPQAKNSVEKKGLTPLFRGPQNDTPGPLNTMVVWKRDLSPPPLIPSPDLASASRRDFLKSSAIAACSAALGLGASAEVLGAGPAFFGRSSASGSAK